MWDRVRDRQTLNTSDLVFSIDDNGWGPGDEAMLDFQQHTPLAQRFVAGSAFFNFHMYGSLRKGGTVTLFSKKYFGYVLSAVVSGYMYVAVEYILMRLAPVVLGLTEDTARSLQGLLNLQWAVVLLLGVVSDSYAPFGYRRKSYILFGWTLVSLLWGTLFALFQCSRTIFGSEVPPPAVAVSFLTAAMLALIVATNTMDIRVIELSQQEELHMRGGLLATYQSLRIGAQVFAHAMVLATASVSSASGPGIQLVLPFPVKLFLLHLAIVALIPIPFIIHYACEEKLKASIAAPHFLQTGKQFWQSAQQKAIWQLIAFNCVLYFFVLLDSSEVNKAISIWTREPSEGRLTRSVVSDVAFVATLLLWKHYGVNANWVVTIGAVLLSWCLVYFSGNTLIVFGVLRFPWMSTVIGVLRSGLRVLLLLSAFVPAIEVAQNGSEGTIFGLLSSFQSIVKLLGAQLVATVERSSSLKLAVEELQASSSSTQETVFYGVLVMTGLKLLSVLALVFCPQQKLDAQQLRVYGGYSRVALLVFVLGYAVSYPLVTYFQYVRFSQ